MVRQRILSVARPLGLEPSLRAARRATEGRTARRNRRDDEHLRVLLAALLRPDSNCIDVGANEGTLTAELVRLAPAGVHLAVEPIPALASSLQEALPQVDVQACALSDRPGSRQFFIEPAAPTRSGFRRQQTRGVAEEIIVPVRRLDDLVSEDREIAFIKIDVEGAEAEVLRGALATLSRCRPLIALEHGASAVRNYGTPHRMVHELLEDCGLSVFDMDGSGPFSAAEFERVADPPGDRWNFFARAS